MKAQMLQKFPKLVVESRIRQRFMVSYIEIQMYNECVKTLQSASYIKPSHGDVAEKTQYHILQKKELII